MWGLGLGMCGDFDQGERLVEKALSFALKTDHLATTAMIELGYGIFLTLRGEGKIAAEHLEKAIHYIEKSQTPVVLSLAWAYLGHSHCLMSQPDAAVQFTEKGLKIHTDLGLPFFLALCHFFCSYAHCETGAIEKARTHAELALDFAIKNNERVLQGISRAFLGKVIAKTDPTRIDQAEQQIIQGIGLLEELGQRSQSCLGHFWLGEVCAETGQPEKARESLKKAEAMFREMGMGYWLAKASDALAGLQG